MGSLPDMDMRPLGGSGVQVPVVCLGTMTFGEQNAEAEAFEIMDYCLSRGVSFFDSAELYPVPPTRENNAKTERIIGNWMRARNNRAQIFLATKVASAMPGMDRSYVVGNRSEPPLEGEDVPQPALTREQIVGACEASLRRLQTDYIDLYQLHWPARYAPLFGGRQYHPDRERPGVPSIDEQVSAMGELINSGKIKHWGLSNETAYGVCTFVEAAKRLNVPPPVSIQNDYSLVTRQFDGETAEACRHHNIGLLAYGVLAGGFLSGKYLEGSGVDVSKSRHTLFAGFQPRYKSPRTTAAAVDLAALAKSKGLTAATLAQAWAASRWFMSSVIIGATTVAQAKENIDACLLKLDKQTLQEVDELFIKHGNTTLQD